MNGYVSRSNKTNLCRVYAYLWGESLIAGLDGTSSPTYQEFANTYLSQTKKNIIFSCSSYVSNSSYYSADFSLNITRLVFRNIKR